MATRKTTTKRGTSSTKTVDDVATEIKNATPEDDKTKKVRAARKARAVSDSAELSIEKVTQSLTKAGLDITKTLNNVRELFETELVALETIKEAIGVKKEELDELFDKEVVATSLRDLVLQHEAHMAECQRNQEEARQAWLKEQADQKTAMQERVERLSKERKQEEEDYEYKKRITRRNDEETWKQAFSQREREQKETEEALEKTWKEREEILKKKEVEVTAAKDKLDNFDQIVDAQVKKDVAIITNKMKSDFETQAKITRLEFDGERKMLEHDNKILKSLVAAKDVEIDKLRAALDKKDSEVKEVAVAAMEAQSGKAALAAVQEHAQSTSSKK
jgi:hypothetical protein